jgi:hypothetical protein
MPKKAYIQVVIRTASLYPVIALILVKAREKPGNFEPS